MGKFNTRLNQVGFVALACLAIGCILAQGSSVSSSAAGFLWVSFILTCIHFLWNLLGFGPDNFFHDDHGRDTEAGAATATSSTAAVGADAVARIARLESQNNMLARENQELKQRGKGAVAAAGAAEDRKDADETARLRAELKLSLSRLAALKAELTGLDERNAEREEQYRQNIRTLQGEIGSLRGDSDKREAVVLDAQNRLQDLKPYVGILIEDLSKRERRETGMVGVRIQTVKPNTPAAAVGFLEGDLIERMNSADMESSGNVMDNLVKRKPGDVCSFIVNRGGEALNVVMTVGHKELNKDEIANLRRLAAGMVLPEDL